MSASLASTLSLITGPALLTNASTVLLLGATNRLGIALDWQRRGKHESRFNARNDQEALWRRRRAAQRIKLLRRAMLLLQAAVGSFGIGTLIAMLGLCIEQTVAPGADILANPAVLFAATAGGAALILGVATLFIESWLFGHAFIPAQNAGTRPSSGSSSHAARNSLRPTHGASAHATDNCHRAAIVQPERKQFRKTPGRPQGRNSIS